MLAYRDADLAALIFHELAHQQAYVPGDSDFNEAFATVVADEGARRWLTRLGKDDELEAYLASRRREREIAELMAATRGHLAAVYQSGAPAAEMRAAKTAELARLGDSLAARGVNAGTGLNNARLAAVATYHRCVPALTALLAGHDGDLPAYYAAIRSLAHDAAARSALCPRS